MKTLDVIAKRRSYRGLFKETPVPREDLVRIMEAGLAAPSGCNAQTVSLIAVDDPAVLAEMRNAMVRPLGQNAPAFICVLCRRLVVWKGMTFAVQDYSAAIENMLLAAVELGYESCWLEGNLTDEDEVGKKIAKVLHVPDEYDLVCILPVGIAQDGFSPREKKPFSQRAWFNTFGAEE